MFADRILTWKYFIFCLSAENINVDDSLLLWQKIFTFDIHTRYTSNNNTIHPLCLNLSFSCVLRYSFFHTRFPLIILKVFIFFFARIKFSSDTRTHEPQQKKETTIRIFLSFFFVSFNRTVSRVVCQNALVVYVRGPKSKNSKKEVEKKKLEWTARSEKKIV